ncbi:MAG: magnesium/cobalt transporter CorA [Candidatus Eisenbacteria bacterium]|uniref:Magnesium transport protein CorA n=1 Tax=Eiseniibacteriota bacterium TaxID=2212470 RepID=A0A956NEC6_UNCEI|nr:magnesium/cobalt transporter CorA [Candidatus Eisenbacteria bacterium]MCB9464507.1 magnesium/cobalt transporter CorA [Candidatus Eisenbacteria bacterium]
MAANRSKIKPSKKGRQRRRLRVRPGAAPGTLLLDPTSPPPTIQVVAFGETELEETAIDSLDRIGDYVGRHPVTWVNVDGLGAIETLERLGAHFNLHPLVLEDIAHTNQRPKMEVYDGACFFIARMPVPAHPRHTEQISIVLGENYVLTFQEFPGDCFDPVRARVRAGRSRIRTAGPDYLVYALLDSILDSYFPLVDSYQDRLEEIEARILESLDEEIVHDLFDLRHELEPHRRIARSYREMFSYLVREEAPLIGSHTEVFFRDCLDHTSLLIELLDDARETGSGLLDLYMSSMGNRMNEIMKVLTITATIFIPMTFVAGIYGMNFNQDASPLNMPELSWYWGYPFAWFLMLALAGGLLVYFRKKRWIGPAGSSKIRGRSMRPDPDRPSDIPDRRTGGGE